MSVIGLRVGPFEIIEPAQVPEPGDWYRARRTGMTRRQPTEVLVKMLSPDAEGPQRAGLQVEFDNLRAMEDPRVPVAVALYEGIGALAIDAPDGIPLDDILQARALGSVAMTPPTLLDLALEIAETLQHAHHRNRSHGHLSGANIRISTSGKVHLFGFTQGGHGHVPPQWLSPEAARGEPTGPATDQWSLAAILAGLITGSTPWSGDDTSQALNGDPESIVEPIERQWPALSRLFRRMLDPEPANRYPSMQPVRQELLALTRKAGGTSEKRDLGKLMARRVSRSVAPDSEIPAEFTAHTAPPQAQAPDLTEATEAHTHAPPDEAALTEQAPLPVVPTSDEMEPPTPPELQERPPPEAADEPPVAPRLDEAPPAPLADAPLAHEPIQPVHPALESEDVPEARRPEDDALLEPTLPMLSPLTGLDRSEDVDDEPTEQYDQARIRQLEDIEFNDSADLESSDVGLPPDDLARALAVDAEPSIVGAFGEGPTAVPITDVSDHTDISIPPNPATEPRAPAPPVYEEREELPIRDAAVLQPVAPEFEPSQAVRDPGFQAPSTSSVQRFAPALVLVMVLLMVIAIAMAVM